MRNLCALLLVICASAPAAAETRKLDVSVDRSWRHTATGIALPPVIADLRRVEIIDLQGAEYDVSAQFRSTDQLTSLSIYIFRSPLPSAQIWFDRISSAVELSGIYGAVKPVELAVPTTRPRSTITSGLKRQYIPGKGPLRSTAVAVFPLNDWLLAIRLSSAMLDSGALSARLDTVLAQIEWPEQPNRSPPAKPISTCAVALKFKLAKSQKQPDEAHAMLQATVAGLMTTQTTAEGKSSFAVHSSSQDWCREGAATLHYGVYRPAKTDDEYVLAIGDAGRVATVRQYPLGATVPEAKGYFVSLRDVDGTIASYPPFDRLPEPAQVVDLTVRTKPIVRTKDGVLTINPGQ